MRRTGKKRGKRFYIGVISAALFVGASILYGLFGRQTEEVDTGESVLVTKIEKPDPLSFRGTVEAKEMQLFFLDQSIGNLQRIAVTDGQKVEKGTILATYQNDTAESNQKEQRINLGKYEIAVTSANENYQLAGEKRRQAANSLAEAKNKRAIAQKNGAENLTELEALVQQAQAEADNQDTAYVQARQTLEAANVDLATANQAVEEAKEKVVIPVTAPFAGYVYLNVQGQTDATVPYIRLVTSETIVKGTLTEYDYKKVAKNQAVTVETNGDKQKTAGAIQKIDVLPLTSTKGTDSATNKSSVASYSFTVTTSEQLHYGSNVQIVIPKSNLEIPISALREKGNEQWIFVVKNGKVKKQAVQAERQGTTAKVTAGVEVGLKVVTNPKKTLKSGQEVVAVE